MGGASGDVIWMCLSVFLGHFLELSSQWHFQDFCNHQLSLPAISEGSCKGEGNLSLKKAPPHYVRCDKCIYSRTGGFHHRDTWLFLRKNTPWKHKEQSRGEGEKTGAKKRKKNLEGTASGASHSIIRLSLLNLEHTFQNCAGSQNFLMKKSFPVCQFGFSSHLWCWGELEGNLSHEAEAVESHRERYTEKRQDGASHPWRGQESMWRVHRRIRKALV